MNRLQKSLVALESESPTAPLCFSTKPQTSALLVDASDGLRWVFPWHHFVHGRHQTQTRTELLLLSFANHRIAAEGSGLLVLLEEAAAFRLERLRAAPADYARVVGGEVYIVRLDVTDEESSALREESAIVST